MPSWTRSLVALLGLALFSCGDSLQGPPDAPRRPQCYDNRDNDRDGLIDFPEDPSCTDLMDDSEEGPRQPACNDNRDNDRDGREDYPEDPGCVAPQADDETDDCPSGANCPMCGNGVDDDTSGTQDYPADMGCESAADNFEYSGSPQACGANLMVQQLPPSGMAMGTLDAMSVSDVSSPCGGGNGLPAAVYVMVLSKPKVVVISTTGSAVDTVLDLRRVPCMDAASELACNDNASPSETSSRIVRSLTPGAYYILVHGRTATQVGTYRLRVQKLNPEGEDCNVQGDCGPGLVCRIPLGGTRKICTGPVCSDGIDDDADGKLDYPNDPGCREETDADEADDCPSGPSCPKCADGVDNDGDGTTDYPLDKSCKAAGDASEACRTSEKPIPVITGTTTTGTTAGARNDYDPSCNSTTGIAPDLLYRIDVPAMSALNLRVVPSGFSAVHALLDSTCGGTSIACSTAQLMTATNLAAGSYYLVVDGFTTGSGAFTITTSGTIAPNGSCETPLFETGVITCGAGFVCDGPAGARTCRADCSDGVDNNGDGKIDYPNDPGCDAPGDNTEDTLCPGPTCPECGDTVDNDGDGQTDYPADTTCKAASNPNERCGTSEPVAAITTPVVTGNTAGQVNDYDPTCNSSTGVAPDLFYQLDVPAMATISINVTGFDTAHSLLNSTCGGTPIRCSDPALMTIPNLAAGTYYLAVDGWGSGSGPFTITTSGQVAVGASCEGALFQSGAFTCTPGFACDGPMGARTCVKAQCGDAMDNNGDGKIDFPSDPGCISTNDNSEDTVCPGPMCPVCSDGIDNDGDNQTDYPADLACKAASGGNELCAATESIDVITTSVVMGNTANAVNDYDPTCNSSTGVAPDLFYQLDVPAMATLSINVTGFDTVHSLLDSTCGGTPIRCSDPALMTIPNVAAGKYFLAVDGWSTGSGPFTITTTGQVAPGGSCEGALFQSGAFTCTSGYACVGPAGARTCSVECGDGMDNNGDGRIDFPSDPGCTSAADAVEDTVCPGANCPACSNMADDDADGLIDWPADFGCAAASSPDERFCTPDPDYKGAIMMPVTSGTLAAPATDDREQSCQPNTGRDVVYSLTSPVTASWVISTEGSTIADTVLSLWTSSCAPPELACDDDGATNGAHSQITMTLPPGTYAIQVDSYTSTGNNGPFQLNVKGTAMPGSDCTSPLFAAGVLACPGVQTCTAGVCQ